ncbi:MAG: hypothetical protein R3B67_13865 [Phycisphaerales bacterium]
MNKRSFDGKSGCSSTSSQLGSGFIRSPRNPAGTNPSTPGPDQKQHTDHGDLPKLMHLAQRPPSRMLAPTLRTPHRQLTAASCHTYTCNTIEQADHETPGDPRTTRPRSAPMQQQATPHSEIIQIMI